MGQSCATTWSASSARGILHRVGDLVFFPSGVPSMKMAFARENGRVTRFTVADPGVVLSAARV